MGQTVNLLAYAFGGSNPSLPTINNEMMWKIPHHLIILSFILTSKLQYPITKFGSTDI